MIVILRSVFHVTCELGDYDLNLKLMCKRKNVL
jgi:hypothetical protein